MRQLLQNVPILAGLDEQAVAFLWDRINERRAAPGAVVLAEGEAGNRFFLVGDGEVKVCKHFGKATEVQLAKLSRGEFFGEMCILETLPRSATVQAVVETQLFSLSSLAFYHLYQEMPGQHSLLLLNIARDLSRRLRQLDEAFAARH
jgi:CRP/FNR family cyclic AMP-dependent transcriptional regulator